MERTSSALLSSAGTSGSALVYSDELEPEPEQVPGDVATFCADDYFGIGPDGRPVFIGTGGLDGAKARELDDLTRIGASGGQRLYRVVRRAAISAGLDLASAEKGHLEVGETIQVAEIVVYAGRARVRFHPREDGSQGGWASIRSGGGRELLQPLDPNDGSTSDTAGDGLWSTPRERAMQLLCGVHGLSGELSEAMLERPVAGAGATELTGDEWYDALCAMGGAEVRDLASLARRKLERCAVIDGELEQANSALLVGDYTTAKRHFCSALASCESVTLERCAVERARAAANGLEQAEKGLKFAAMSDDDLLRTHVQVADDAFVGQRLGIAGGGGGERRGGGGDDSGSNTTMGPTLVHVPTDASCSGPHGRPRAPLPPYPGPSRPTASMFSIYWRMPKGEPAPIGFEVE